MADEAIPVVFIHGLWLHASSWTPWVELFAEKGYAPVAPGWPGDSATVAETRANPDAVANKGIGDITDHYAKLIAELPTQPIVIGHSFGGLIAQKLLAQGAARACVALSPAQFKGILVLPVAQLASAGPILSKPWLKGKTWSHTKESFHKSFASAIPQEESDEIFEKFTIPSPAKPLFQAGLANFTPKSEAAVDTKAARGPLLLIAGGKDRTVPQATVESANKIQLKNNKGVTEFKAFADRGHSLGADHGWHEIADTALEFLSRKGFGPPS